jgi:hypothetical protein
MKPEVSSYVQDLHMKNVFEFFTIINPLQPKLTPHSTHTQCSNVTGGHEVHSQRRMLHYSKRYRPYNSIKICCAHDNGQKQVRVGLWLLKIHQVPERTMLTPVWPVYLSTLHHNNVVQGNVRQRLSVSTAELPQSKVCLAN